MLDAEELLEEVDNDREMLAQMFQIFESDAEERVSRIRAAIDAGDATTLMEEAHALKGGIGNFFADVPFETAYRLETMGKEGDMSDAARVCAELEGQLEVLKSAIRKLIDD